MNNRKSQKKRTWCQKEKQRQITGIILATSRMILTKHVFCVNSVLHLLPRREVTQLICLTIYVGTTQLNMKKKKQVRSVQVNCPQDSRSAASHKVLFKSSDENSFIFSYHNIYRRVKIKSQGQFFPISCSPNSYFHKILTQ